MGMDLDPDRGADDLERGERDLEIDLHVVDRQRVRVDVDVQPRRLLIAHRAADQQQIVPLAEGPDAVLAIVEHFERFAVVAERGGRQDRAGVEQVVERSLRRGGGRVGHRCTVPRGVPTNPTDGQVSPVRQDGGVSELAVVALPGRFVLLEPMRADHIDEIAAAGGGDRSSFGYTQVPDGRDEAADYVHWLLDDAAHGRAAPFVQRRVADGVVVGCTRFLNPLWPLGRDDPDEVEIGGTWLSASAQRTPINSEAKLLLLTHAFDGVEGAAGGDLHRRPQRAEPAGDRAPRSHVRRGDAEASPLDPRR